MAELRPYSTIGIEGFISAPPHPLPSEYLVDKSSQEDESSASQSTSAASTARSFASWEILGVIKDSPADFVVREILQKNKVIPGLSEEDINRLRLADVSSEALPRQVLPQQVDDQVVDPASKRQRTPDDTSVTPQTTKWDDDKTNEKVSEQPPSSPAEIIQAYLVKVATLIDAAKVRGDARLPTADELIESLESLHQQAIQNIENSQATTPLDNTPKEVWIPPLPPLSPEDQNDEKALTAVKKERGAFHKAVRLQYPFFKTESSTWNNVTSSKEKERNEKSDSKNMEDHWIRVAIDDTFLDLVPFLHEPPEDLQRLLRFQNRGFEGALENNKNQKEHLSAMQKLTQNLRCRQSDIGFAGIKDLQAITYQFITLRNMKPKRAENANWQLSKYGLRLGLFYNVDFSLNTGELEGNQFDVRVRNLKRVRVEYSGGTKRPKETLVSCDWEHLQSMFERVRKHGFLNFFGEQRVGVPGSADEVGVRAFDIGKAMLQKESFLNTKGIPRTGHHATRKSNSSRLESICGQSTRGVTVLEP
ncbi:MAG: hypothetical protein SGILL_002482 [Bacillariaceae sp.]